jgi:hypothetical protein
MGRRGAAGEQRQAEESHQLVVAERVALLRLGELLAFGVEDEGGRRPIGFRFGPIEERVQRPEIGVLDRRRADPRQRVDADALTIGIAGVERLAMLAGNLRSPGDFGQGLLEMPQVAGADLRETFVAEELERELQHTAVRFVAAPVAILRFEPVEPILDRVGEGLMMGEVVVFLAPRLVDRRGRRRGRWRRFDLGRSGGLRPETVVEFDEALVPSPFGEDPHDRRAIVQRGTVPKRGRIIRPAAFRQAELRFHIRRHFDRPR